jgi:hypothetical protein
MHSRAPDQPAFFEPAKPFKMVFDEKADDAFNAWADGELEPRDVAILFLVCRLTNYKTGKAHVTISELAARVRISPSHASRSIKRLKEQQLLAIGVEARGGGRFLMPNPYLISNRKDAKGQGERWPLFSALTWKSKKELAVIDPVQSPQDR